MMQFRSTRLRSAIAIAGLILLVGVPRGEAQLGEEGFGPAAKSKNKLRFTTSFGASDPFASMNQVAGGKARRGDTFQVVLSGTPAKGYHTYPITRRAPEQQEIGLPTVKLETGVGLTPLYPVAESEAEWGKPGATLPWQLEHEKPFTWAFEFRVKPDAPVGSMQDITFAIKAQVCNENTCTWEDHVVKVSVPVGQEEPLSPPAETKGRDKPVAPSVVPVPENLKNIATKEKPALPDADTSSTTGTANPTSAPAGLIQAILVAIVGGLFSLLTPCVFPMIPITVSYFLKQSESKQRSAVLMALVYSATIALVLTLGGLLLLKTLQSISTWGSTNLILGGIFLFFAFSLLGWYDVSLPSWLQDATAAREGKGGLLGVFFMALTFSIVSFACVGPIYGGFIGITSSTGSAAELVQQALPVVAFSVAFASPFFLLALFPSLLRKMPRAGSWMNKVKVVMGFLELAAAVKFLRSSELGFTLKSTYLTFDLALGIYVVLALACGLYLLGVYRLPHDHEPEETIGVPRLLFSLSFISLGLYLAPGLFKKDDGESQRPQGTIFAWTSAFLVPELKVPKATTRAGGDKPSPGLVWHTKLKEALALAEREQKLVFVDVTGIGCTNCSLNEDGPFRDPRVQEAFGKLVLVRLYSNPGVPPGIDQEPDLQGTIQFAYGLVKEGSLPLYVVLRPEGERFAVVRSDKQGLIRDIPAFVKFLTP
jgi:thiol:disulfide interchange protein DsbD